MRLSHDPQALRKLVVISIFAALATVLGILETLIPLAVTIPGAKLGLGNILVLACLWLFGGKDALWLIVIKTLLTAFLLGSFSTFLFSILGALGSFAIMFVMLRFARDEFSLISVSILGGIGHNLGQLSAASIVLGTTRIYYYLPFLLAAGVVTGVFVGLAAKHLIAALERLNLFEGLKQPG